MSLFLRQLCIAACLAAWSLGVAVGGEGGGAQEPVVELGRQFKALPWLETAPGVPFEVVKYADIPLLAGFPAQTAYYTIDPEVVASAYSYFFYVRGVGNEYKVGSTIGLVKLCNELAVLEELKRQNKGKEFATGVGQGLKSVGTGLANLVMHPGLSLKSAGTRVRQTGRSLERAVGEADKVGDAEGGDDRSNLGSGPAGAARRAIAYELGVDVYTSNPVMRQALVELSQIRTAGGLITWAIPYNIGMLSYMNPIAGDDRTETIIRDYEPYELRRLVGEELEPILQMNREDKGRPLNQLLMNPNYTPRSIAYIGLDLSYLRSVANLALVVTILAGAETPEEADMLAFELRLYSFLYRRIQPLREFVPNHSIFSALGTNGVFYFMFFADTLRPWKVTGDIFNEMIRQAMAAKAVGMEIWVAGDVDPRMIQQAASQNVTVRQNILRDTQFFPMPEQKR